MNMTMTVDFGKEGKGGADRKLRGRCSASQVFAPYKKVIDIQGTLCMGCLEFEVSTGF